MTFVSTDIAGRFRESAAHSVLWRRLESSRALWHAAERAVGALTRQRDETTGDEITEAVMAASAIGRTGASLRAAFDRAWPTSSAARWMSMRAQILGDDPIVRMRAAAWIVAIAMLTALLLRATATRPAPVSWLVPTAALAAACVVLAGATARRPKTPDTRRRA